MTDKEKALIDVVNKLLPIVQAAYWDHASAWAIPGAGYNNRAQSLAGSTFNAGFCKNDTFEKFTKEVEALIK